VFQGRFINVVGSIGAGVDWPSCMVDNVAVSRSSGSWDVGPSNNYVFCSTTLPLDGPHVLTVNATVGENPTFWFDRIEYAPSNQDLPQFEQKAVKLSAQDTSVGWSQITNEPSFMINLTLPFYGKFPETLLIMK
jgi:hypothetical protein